jgi:hypothetical protein
MKPAAHVMPSSMVGQSEQAEAFARLIVPKAHGRLTLVLAPQYCPAGHGSTLVDPAVHNPPGGHGCAWRLSGGQYEPAGHVAPLVLLAVQ